MNQLQWIANALDELDTVDLRRHRVARLGAQGARIQIGDQQYANFGSNDYLGLAGDSRVVNAATQAAGDAGWGSGASPLILGRSDLHQQLENTLAAFLQREASLLFPTGFAANMGTIPALAGRGDIILSDAKNHASIIDGCRLSLAEVQVYPHGDMSRLRELLNGAGRFRRRLIVTDSLFSMDGDLAPLDRLVDLAREHQAMLMVDEAHAVGVQGDGRGVAAEMGVDQGVDVYVGTLSKSFGAHGGFVAGSRQLIEYLSNRARSYVFSTAAPAAVAAAGSEAIRIAEAEPERRARVLQLASMVRDRLGEQGWRIGSSQSHVIPVILGQPTRALQVSAALRAAGYWVPCIRPPSVPPGESLLRISLSAGHTDEMVDGLVAQLQQQRQ